MSIQCDRVVNAQRVMIEHQFPFTKEVGIKLTMAMTMHGKMHVIVTKLVHALNTTIDKEQMEFQCSVPCVDYIHRELPYKIDNTLVSLPLPWVAFLVCHH